MLYLNGKGVTKDQPEAVRRIRRAAEHGLPHAQFLLGAAYYTGLGVPQNFGQAYIWFSLAAANGEKKAVKDRDDVAQELTRSALLEAQKITAAWKPKSNPANKVRASERVLAIVEELSPGKGPWPFNLICNAPSEVQASR
jgi:hypothetical protein